MDAVIAIGASAGGVPALEKLMAGMPADLPAAIVLVLHVGAHESRLPAVLSRKTRLAVEHAEQGDALRAGCVHVAPPDHHMLVGPDGRIALSRGPKEHYTRPAIDPLFRSVALAYGPRAIGVILTGMLDDGTAGLQAIKQGGGRAVVQDPADAAVPSMPASAMAHVAVDHCAPLQQLPDVLLGLVAEQTRARHDKEADMASIKVEQELFCGEGDALELLRRIGEPSPFACPDCHGGLWRLRDVSPPRFRCHTGHAYSGRTLEHGYRLASDQAEWNALRALQEHAALVDQLLADPTDGIAPAERERLDRLREKLRDQTAALRQIIEDPQD